MFFGMSKLVLACRDSYFLNKYSKTVSDEKELCRTLSTYFANIVLQLQASANILFSWFKYNHLKANFGKSHFLLSNKNPAIVSIDGSFATSFNEELL